MAFIYKLIDPRDGEIRYVGKTEYFLQHRYSTHLAETKRGSKRHVCNWIRQLVDMEILPTIELLEEVPNDDWEWYETWWIIYGRIVGWKLTNHTNGGEGHSGHSPSEETRRKLSEATKGRKHTDEHCRKIGEAHKGRKYTDENPRANAEAIRGENHHSAKLTESGVHEIRQMIADGKTDKEIAEIYGVVRETISKIRHGRIWGWLK